MSIRASRGERALRTARVAFYVVGYFALLFSPVLLLIGLNSHPPANWTFFGITRHVLGALVVAGMVAALGWGHLRLADFDPDEFEREFQEIVAKAEAEKDAKAD